MTQKTTSFLLAITLIFLGCCGTLLAQPMPDRYRTEVFSTISITNNVTFSTNIQTAVVTTEIAGNKIRTDESSLVNITLKMDIYKPANFVPAWGGLPDTLKKKPVIVLCFGGGFVTGSRTAWDMVALATAYAKRGFVVGVIDYRLGMNIFDENLAMREVYRALQDGRSAVRYFKANATALGIDPNHVYIAGYSAGGFISYQNAFMDNEFERPASTYSWSYSCGFFGLSTCVAPNQGCLDCVGDNLTQNGKASLFMGFAGAVGFLNNIEGPTDIPGVMFHSTDDSVVPYTTGIPFLTGLGALGSIIGLVVDLPTVYGSGLVKPRMDLTGADGTLYTYATRDHGPHKWDVNNDGDYDNDQTLYPESYINSSEFAYQKKLKPLSTTLSGPSQVCNGVVTATYSLNNNDFYYDWNIVGGTFVTPLATRQYSNTVTVQWAAGAGPRTLTVTPYSRQLARGENLIVRNVTTFTVPDLGVTQLTGAANACGTLSAAQVFTAKIKNLGCVTALAGSSFTVTLTETTTGANYTENITLAANMLPNDEMLYTFAGTINMSATGTYNLTASTNVVSDPVPANNVTNLTVVLTPIPTAPTAANASVCFGGTIPTLTATGANLIWYSDLSLTTTVATGASFTPSVSAVGTYNYYVTQTVAGCVSATKTVILTINPLPIVSFAALSPVCINAAAITLSATPTGGTFSGTGVSAGVFNPTTAGAGTHNITYSYTDANGCASSASQSIVVNPLPIVSFAALSPVCINAAPITLSATPTGGTFSGTGVSAGVFNPTTAGAGTHSITYTYTDANGCSKSASQNIVVNPLPIVSFAALSPVCINAAAITLSATPTGGTFSGTGVSAGVFNPTTAGAGTHSITYAYTDANGCSKSASQSIVVNPLPIVSLTVPSLCTNGVSYTFVGGSPAGGTYQVDGVATTSFTPTASPSSHTVTYTYTNANGCTASISKPMNVVICPVGVPAPNAPSYLIVEAIDENNMRLKWNDSNTDEDGYEIYRSTDNANFVILTLTPSYTSGVAVFVDTNLNPDKAYYYIVRVKRGDKRSGFSNSAYDYTYPLAPTLVEVKDACMGSYGTVTVQGTHESNLFRWYKADGTVAMDYDGSFYGFASFGYERMYAPMTVSVASKGHRYESRTRLTVNIGIKPLPIAQILTTNTRTCEASTLLKATAVAGAVYEWIFNDRLYAVTTVPEVSVTENGVYRLRIQANDCANVASEMIAVELNYKPEAKILGGKLFSFCKNGELAAKEISGASYTWRDGNGAIIGTERVLSVVKNGIYNLEVNENGCLATTEAVVAVTTFPINPNLTSSNAAVCEKEIVEITADLFDYTYEWAINGRVAQIGTKNTFKFAAKSGENRVSLVLRDKENNLCENPYSDFIFNAGSFAKLAIFRENAEIKTNIVGTVTAIKWYFEGVEMLENANKTSITPTKSGNYSYKAISDSGCENASGSLYFGINGTEETAAPEKSFVIYPNPTKDILQIRFTENTEASIYLLDMLGRKVKQAFLNAETLSINLADLPAGVYVLEIHTQNGTLSKKVVKE